MKMEQTECSEKSAYKIQTPGIYPEERIQMSLCTLYDIYLAAIGLTPGGSSTAHIYTQAVHRIQRKEHT